MPDEQEQEAAAIGPFTDGEIESAARNAVLAMGRDWQHTEPKDQRGFVDEAKLILAGGNVSSRFGYLVPGTTGAVENQFKTLVLQEFRNSPKWDEAEFKAGFGAPAKSAGESSAAGSEVTQ